MQPLCTKCIFGVAGAVFGAHVFAAMRCINALSGAWAEVKRGVFSVSHASSAQSFHFSLESLCAEPGAGSQARELFCCLWFSVKSLFLKGSRGGLDFDSLCTEKQPVEEQVKKS